MDTPEFSFASMQDAVSSLLVDVTSFLNTTGHPYLVVGGWAPYLRNSTVYPHPGTRDIDILFSDGNVREKLRDVIRGLLDKGYKASAKHDFQLLRTIKVKDHQLVFNVDLLHPAESVNNPEMMVDHFDLGIRDDELSESKAIKSIVLPSSALLFAEGFWTPFRFTGTNLDGGAAGVTFPLIDLAGSVLSKCESVSVKKRPRDAFDIFIAIESDTDKAIPRLLRQYKNLDGVRSLIEKLSNFVGSPPLDLGLALNQFDMNVYRYLKGGQLPGPTPAARVQAVLEDA